MKFRTEFICQQCGYRTPKWMGKCSECSAWNSLVEEVTAAESTKSTHARSSSKGKGPVPINEVEENQGIRIQLSSGEINRVLGGGLTIGSVVLLAGDPGIGKSTLLLQILGSLAQDSKKKVLYVSGEESAGQLKMRAARLGISTNHLYVLAETNLIEVLTHLENINADVVVIDSVQTLYWPELTSIPGSVSQVREVADRLVRFAKQHDTPIFLVGHVTKEGGVAGPMSLEHLVDTVLFFEGERGHAYRILRAMKNRFGATDEIGVFDMHETGLIEVPNPSELFLRDRPQNTPGTVVFPALEGSRPLLVEIQGLASKTTYGVPLRTSIGFDKNRLGMLLAVLEKRAKVFMGDQDVYVNVVGGIRIDEPSVDLAVVTAVLSSFLKKPFPNQTVVFGEVGLTGEIRTVSQSEARLKEASKLGFQSAVLPMRSTCGNVKIECREIPTVFEILDFLR